MLAAQWGIPSLFQASAVPQVCSALVILGLALLSRRRGRAPSGEMQHDALSVPERA
jgi:AAHS family 4-hydroxybenzoate transporter-like MFS transporter